MVLVVAGVLLLTAQMGFQNNMIRVRNTIIKMVLRYLYEVMFPYLANVSYFGDAVPRNGRKMAPHHATYGRRCEVVICVLGGAVRFESNHGGVMVWW